MAAIGKAAVHFQLGAFRNPLQTFDAYNFTSKEGSIEFSNMVWVG